MNKMGLFGNSILSLTTLVGLFSFFIQPVYSQTNSTTNFWQKIFQPSRNPQPPIKPRKGGSRPGQPICLISPDASSQTRIIWNTQPLFIWKNGANDQGTINRVSGVKKIAVGLLDNLENNQQFLHTQIVTEKQHINYQGKPLQPGKTYTWLIFLNQESTSPAMFVPFQIMAAPQRDRITTELKLLERLHQNKGSKSEAIALVKARYFANKGLWSDALQQAYSVPNPSPQLSQLISDLPNQLCK